MLTLCVFPKKSRILRRLALSTKRICPRKKFWRDLPPPAGAEKAIELLKAGRRDEAMELFDALDEARRSQPHH
jgi:hypothetical protein